MKYLVFFRWLASSPFQSPRVSVFIQQRNNTKQDILGMSCRWEGI